MFEPPSRPDASELLRRLDEIIRIMPKDRGCRTAQDRSLDERDLHVMAFGGVSSSSPPPNRML